MKSNSLSVSRTGDVGQFFDTVLLHYSRQVLYYFLARIGIDKVCRTHAHSGCARHHHFDYVFGARNSAYADNGYFYRVVHLVNHAERQREQCGSGISGGYVLNYRLAGSEINTHTRKRVNHAYAVRAAATTPSPK